MKRKSFIKLLTGSVVTTITLNSCCKNTDPGPEALVYDDTDEFYEKLKANINKDVPFKVVCDGSVKITKDCKFLQILQDEKNLSKADLFKSFDELDKSEEGREALSAALAPELIQHRKPTAQEIAHVQKEHKDNLVLDPVTLFLIISLVVVTVAAGIGAKMGWFKTTVGINPIAGITVTIKPV